MESISNALLAEKHFVEYLMKKRGYTKETISKLVKISTRTVTKIENGTPRKFDPRLYTKLIDCFCKEILKEGERGRSE